MAHWSETPGVLPDSSTLPLQGIVVKGEYELTDAPGQKATVLVTDTRGHTLYKREDFTETTGKFAFTADEYDIFEICISTKLPQGTLRSNLLSAALAAPSLANLHGGGEGRATKIPKNPFS